MRRYYNPYFENQFIFYKLPKKLFVDQQFKNISTDSKILYTLLLDRTKLSYQNKMIDDYGKIYQYFTVKEACEILNFGHEKVIRLFKELTEADLIERRQEGFAKACKIYVKDFESS